MKPFLLSLLLVGSSLAADRPNIIFMMLDDCSAVEFSCYGTEDHPAGQQTPEVDSIAESGLRFETCWATPMCKPTRALLMSGKYAYQTGQYGNWLTGAEADFPKHHKPISKTLKEHGYKTAISGKWHLPGSVGQPEYGWDEYSMLGGYIGKPETDIEWDGPWFEWGSCDTYFHDKAIIGKNQQKYPSLHWNGCVIENGKLLPSDENTYAPDLNQAFALDFIRRNKENPFYLYYPCVIPHMPWMKIPGGEPGMPAQVRQAEIYLKQLVETLKEEGLYDNTIIFFTADNATQGYGKGTTSEIGVRVPLIVFGGPVKAKGVTEAMVDFADMYPTQLEYAGIDPATVPGLDGKSFKPVLDGESKTGKEFLFSYNDAFRTVRTEDYMMDGSGGIWRCDPSRNPIDYKPLPINPESEGLRQKMLKLIESYPQPKQEDFKKNLYKHKEPKWPSVDFGTTRYIKMGDGWMNQTDRSKP
ncbi:MAG: sulfatase-like hydrolase/transferase [Akkermansiaceae bacterium]|jgi:arylsulfatase A|nr:sulfatase-like hydrolase/transferase [Akkermansiaceae bacterium]MDP4721330.1 sulfatase-like hydrolase/transferase [Akkermansiaceae bacterium]MDP4779449.1 sulfatase-like hydrolase/transferase [Akkermansiaceae bacterium]MDP4846789.1 sulfatase-like hydrolase/transferase [Akkermansiaceae bacterium]MDP4897126.1 sulfatase-like hydrolase/transferase [Akkermansiaceae bacterium]